MLEAMLIVWGVEVAALVATGPLALSWWRRRRARRDFPRARVRRGAAALMLSACASSRPPAPLSNHEIQIAPPAARVCESLLVQPAMLCYRNAMLFFDGCRWRCVELEPGQ